MLRPISLCLVFSACTGSAPPPAVPSSAEGGSPVADSAESTPRAQASPPDSAAGAAVAAPDGSVSPEPPPGTKTLPAVSVQNVGLHVGGGPNDAAGKAPFLRAVEQRFPEFLRCYRLIAEPGQSGTFGVDLHIQPSGGKPRVEQPRSGLGGDEFRACVVAVFEGVEFAPVARPTVVSYSLRFRVDEAPESLSR